MDKVFVITKEHMPYTDSERFAHIERTVDSVWTDEELAQERYNDLVRVQGEGLDVWLNEWPVNVSPSMK